MVVELCSPLAEFLSLGWELVQLLTKELGRPAEVLERLL